MSMLGEKAMVLINLSMCGGVLALPKGTDLPRKALRKMGIMLKTKTIDNTLWVTPIPLWFYGFE